MRLHFNQDSVAGLMFVAFGAAGLWFGRNYPVGTSLRMGPGYMPFLLSWLLILFGAGIGLKGALTEGIKLDTWYFRPLTMVLLGVLAFAFTIDRFGFVVATIACVVVGAIGGREFKFFESVALGVGLAIVSVGVFIYGLRLPLDIWPQLVR
jgi:hypothetical protein